MDSPRTHPPAYQEGHKGPSTFRLISSQAPFKDRRTCSEANEIEADEIEDFGFSLNILSCQFGPKPLSLYYYLVRI